MRRRKLRCSAMRGPDNGLRPTRIRSVQFRALTKVDLAPVSEVCNTPTPTVGASLHDVARRAFRWILAQYGITMHGLLPALWRARVALLLVCASAAAAQDTRITASVVDATSGVPVQFARVTNLRSGAERFADAEGRFGIEVTGPSASLRIRSIGFLPFDTVLAVPHPGTVIIRLRRLPTQLEVVRVSGRTTCGAAAFSDGQGDTLRMIFGQLRESAERARLLADAYPFTATFERTRTSRGALATGPRTAQDTFTVASERRWKYAPGRIVVRASSTTLFADERVMILQLPDLAADAFIENHCFRYRGIEEVAGTRVFRIDFSPAPHLNKVVDAAGTIYLAIGSFELRRTKVTVDRVDRRYCSGDETTVETDYRGAGPDVPFIDRVRSTTTILASLGSTCAQTIVQESHRLLRVQEPRALQRLRKAVPILSPAESSAVIRAAVQTIQTFALDWRREWSLAQRAERYGGRLRPDTTESLALLCNDQLEFTRVESAPVLLNQSAYSNEAIVARRARRLTGSSAAMLDAFGSPTHPHILSDAQNHFSVCPIWIPPDDSRTLTSDLGVDFELPLGARVQLREKERPVVVRAIDSLAALLPRDRWLVGQQVRMHLERGDVSGASELLESCQADEWWCTLLEGFTKYWVRDLSGADRLFQLATSQMPPAERCLWQDISLLLKPNDREIWQTLSCAAKESASHTFWWLADPLFLDQGNDRRAEQMGRKVQIALRERLEFDERWDWRELGGRAVYTELVERFGWPTVMRDWNAGLLAGPAASSLTGAERASTERELADWMAMQRAYYGAPGVALEYSGPKSSTLPAISGVEDPMGITASFWSLGPGYDKNGNWERSWWPHEFYARDGGPLLPLELQFGMFRRPGAIIVAAAAKWEGRGVAGDGPKDLVFGASFWRSADSMTTSAADTVKNAGQANIVFAAPPRRQLASFEMLTLSTPAPARRARFAVTSPQGLEQVTGIALSDVVMAEPSSDGTPPTNIREAARRMLPTTELVNPSSVVLFFEAYGLGPAAIDIRLTLVKASTQNVASKLAATVGIGRRTQDSLAVSFRQELVGDPIVLAGKTVRPMDLGINLSQLTPGSYTLKVQVAQGDAVAVTRREIRIFEDR